MLMLFHCLSLFLLFLLLFLLLLLLHIILLLLPLRFLALRTWLMAIAYPLHIRPLFAPDFAIIAHAFL